MIYEPREDTYLLAEQVKKHVFGKVLDMGTGSGYLAESVGHLKKVKSILAVDINDEVIKFLKKKKLKRIKIRKSDLFSNVKERFDTIIFNPPYLPFDPREPEDSRLTTTGGKKGWETLAMFLYQLNDHLSKNGFGLILFSSLTNKNKVDEIIKEMGFDKELLKEEKMGLETLYVYKIKRNWISKELFEKKMVHTGMLDEGHRGVIYVGTYKGKMVAIKAQRFDIKSRTIDRESDMIKRVNKAGIAPKFVFKGKNYFVYTYVPGILIGHYLVNANKKETKKVMLEVLRQCRVLDKMKISKQEMTNPYKHVIINNDKVVLLDFERAHYDPEPKNISQFCQYIMRNHELFRKKEIKFSKDSLINLAKAYKNNQTEANYNKIKSFISSF